MKRFWSVLLLVAAAASCRRVQPEALYEQGREALHRGELTEAERIAKEGERSFAAQPYWRELFGLLDAEAVFRTDPARARSIFEETPATGASLPTVRRLMTCALFEPAHADELYERADALAARDVPQLRPEIAMMRIRLATRDEDAVRFARQAIDGATALKQTWIVANAYRGLGFKESKHNWEAAIGAFQHALQAAQTARNALLEAASRTTLGWAYIETGDYEQALPHLHRALELAERHADTDHEHIALVKIADIYERRNELGKALPYARRGLLAAHQPTQLANAYHQLAQIELELEHYDIAAPLNEEARKARKAAGENELHERSLDARLLAENGNPAGAINVLDDLLASHYGTLDNSARCRAQGSEAGIYFRLGQFDNAERMFKETLTTADKVRSQIKGTASLAFERNLLAFYDSYVDLLLKQDRRADALLVAESSRARVLKEKISYSSNVDPRALARRKNATILCYWLGEKRSLVWSVTANGIDVATLEGADVIDRAAAAYQRELQLPRREPLKSELGAPLYKMLVAPAKVATRRVIILPDSHLNALSFEALIVPSAKPHFWIEDVTVSYSPSLLLLAGTREWKPRDGLLVMGAVPGAGPDFPELKRAGEEIDDVVQSFDRSRCVDVRGTAATPAAYLGLHPERFQFIHFAAHGTANETAPFDSSVILAGGALHGYDIIRNNHPLTAELVTVSSCNSAGGRSYAGEGMVGLAWAFLGAGAHRVVAAQWDVNDRAAPPLMKTMYAEIASGAEPAEALRTAKLALLKSDEMNRPAFWAPFVIYEAM